MSKEIDTKQMLLLEDFPANHSVSQEKEKEQMTIDTSGTKLLESLENVSPNGSLAKMLKALLTSTTAWYSDRCKLTWKKKVSKSNVLLFQLQASVLGTCENEFGLWATPNTMDCLPPRSEQATTKQMTTARKGRTKPANLREQVDQKTMEMYGWMYPTPSASNCMDVMMPPESVEQNSTGWTVTRKKTGRKFGAKLNDVVNKIHYEMYPTPRASKAMTENMETIAKRNKYNSKLEEKIAMEMYPTPTTRDWKDTMGTVPPSRQVKSKQTLGQRIAHNNLQNNKHGGKLNPEFVEFLMGYPSDWTKIETTE